MLSFETSASSTIFCSSIRSSTMRSIRWKYSSCMVARLGACALGRDQFVDPGAQVFQDEVLFGGRLAVVDFLGPLFQGQLNSERLVDCKGDVEEIQAVDPQIVDRVALRRDRIARYVAGFSDNRCHLIECR